MKLDLRRPDASHRRGALPIAILAFVALAVGFRKYQTARGRRVKSYVALPSVTAWVVGGVCVLMIALLCLFASRVRCSYALVTAALVVVVAGTTGRQLSQQRACDTGNARAMLQQMITRTTVTSSIPMRQCVGESNAYFANWRVVVPRLSRADHIAVVSFMDDYGLIDDDAASPIAVTREYEIEASSFDDETTLVVFRRR